jgi:rubrerythrin
MSEARATNPLVDQFRKGGVPKELRLMAAQGALPLKPEDLVELLTDLTGDADPGVQEAARQSLVAFPVAELLPIAKSRETPAAVLTWIVTFRTEKEVREVALQNTSLPDETIEALCPELPEELAELVVINQTRLLRRLSLLEAIEASPSLNKDQQRRLRELRETFRIGEQPAPPPPPPAPQPAPPPAFVEPVIEDVPISESEAIVRYLSDAERAQTEKVSAVQKLYRLNAAEKMITALKGTREERAILVRDPNRIVAAAVLGSSKVTDAEIESFASMKNVSDAVLRTIGNHKDWTKRYGVIANLVRNPRTPIAISLGMVSRLNPRDIKSVAVDKNVPEAIRKQAQRFVRTPSGSSAKH